jgi:hypothetical protein
MKNRIEHVLKYMFLSSPVIPLEASESLVCPRGCVLQVTFPSQWSQIGLGVRNVIWVHWVDACSVASVGQSEPRTRVVVMFILAFWWLCDHLTLYQELGTGKFLLWPNGWSVGLKLTQPQGIETIRNMQGVLFRAVVSTWSDRFWVPSSLLSNGYHGLFPWG